MNARERIAVHRAAAAALLWGALAWGCVDSHHHHAPPPPVFSFVELEPNDAAPTANYLGAIYPGETFLVRGFIEDSGLDPFDGFALTALEPLEVELLLWIDEPFADLDLCFYDPASGSIEACFETAADPETGWLAFGGPADFQLVVASYSGDSSYTLEVIAHPLGYAPASGATPATAAPARERERPLEAYAGAAAALPKPPSPRGWGRVVRIDPESGARAEQAFAVGPDGLRVGPPLLRR
jgi:hypothetical protein